MGYIPLPRSFIQHYTIQVVLRLYLSGKKKEKLTCIPYKPDFQPRPFKLTDRKNTRRTILLTLSTMYLFCNLNDCQWGENHNVTDSQIHSSQTLPGGVCMGLRNCHSLWGQRGTEGNRQCQPHRLIALDAGCAQTLKRISAFLGQSTAGLIFFLSFFF